MWQCSAYMIALAWREKEKKVVLLCLLQVFLAVAGNLVNLYVSPSILSVLERHASFSEFIATVLLFVLLLLFCSAAASYVDSNTIYGRITVRSVLIADINRKACTTSYPNLTDETFIRLSSKAQQAISNNREATEAIWETLASLMKNSIGFIIYLFLLVSLNLWLMIVILLTALTGYFVNKKLTGYGYRHREEEGEISAKIWYQIGQAKNYAAAKDIRIFGMKPWLQEISRQGHGCLYCFSPPRQQYLHMGGKYWIAFWHFCAMGWLTAFCFIWY